MHDAPLPGEGADAPLGRLPQRSMATDPPVFPYPVAPARSPESTAVRTSKARLLVVDDDLAAIRQLGTLLSGYAQVSFATSGVDALALARTQRPDLILLDAEMPDMSGFEVFKILRAEVSTADVPVVFATSHTDPDIEASVIRLGAADFLSKPFVATQVLARVKAQLQRHGQRLVPNDREGTRRPRLLIVDDDAAAIQVLQHLLADVGDCHFALDGQQALELAATLSPDLVLLDIDMPGANGLQVCQWLKDSRVSHRPEVVFVTQFRTANSEAQAFAVGADDFIGKPYSASVLLARVRSLVERKQRVEADMQAARTHLPASTASQLVGPASSDRPEPPSGDDELARRATQTMLSFIAHEMGNPLNAILGLSALARTDPAAPLHPVQRKRLEHISEASMRLKDLMHDVIDLGRLQTGKFRFAPEPVDVESVIQGVCTELAIAAEAAGSRIELALRVASAVVTVDPRRLHQCVANLVSNGIKYGGRPGRVDVTVGADGSDILISVRDAGAGLSEAQRAELFQPYNRLGRDASDVPGTGLGLLLTRELTAAMGGRLELAEGGGGSCFTLRFARAEAEERS